MPPVSPGGLRTTAVFDQLDLRPAPVITARACALPALLDHVVVRDGGDGLSVPGRAKADEELTEAGRHWKMSLERRRSVTDSSGTILILKDLKRRDKTERSDQTDRISCAGSIRGSSRSPNQKGGWKDHDRRQPGDGAGRLRRC